MKYDNQYKGKWVAVSDNKVVAAAKSLKILRETVRVEYKIQELKYTLVPKGFVAG